MMASVIKFEAPERCSRCPCLRNNEFGSYCFLTQEELHDIDINYQIGRYCPSIEDDNNLYPTNFIESKDGDKILLPLNNGGQLIIYKTEGKVEYYHD